MKTEYYNTWIETLCHFTEVTDEEIKEQAAVEVKKIDEEDELLDPEAKDGASAFDRAFLADPKYAYGYVTLPEPVVNINYLYGSKPILPRLLNRNRKELEDLIYFGKELVVKTNDPKQYPVGASLPFSSKQDEMEARQKAGVETCSGADAIQFLMGKAGVTDPGILHRVFPVLPLAMRTMPVRSKTGEEAYMPTPLEHSTEHVIWQCQRYNRLNCLHAPEIILLNERRRLQEYVDAAVNNGARRGLVATDPFGYPYYSLQQEYCMITEKKNLRNLLRADLNDLDRKTLESLAKEYGETDTRGFGTIEDGEPEFIENEEGEMCEAIDENDPVYNSEAVRKRYQDYQKKGRAIAAILTPVIDRFLAEKYPQYRRCFAIVKEKIIENALKAARNSNHYDEAFRQILISYPFIFFTNGTPFLDWSNEEENR